jgi:hypothetical protein
MSRNVPRGWGREDATAGPGPCLGAAGGTVRAAATWGGATGALGLATGGV